MKTALLTALKERDLAVIRGAHQFYVSLGQPGSEDVLAESLDRYGDQAMAEYFLNCGDVKLEDAARLWGAKQRWKITQQMYGVTWESRYSAPESASGDGRFPLHKSRNWHLTPNQFAEAIHLNLNSEFHWR